MKTILVIEDDQAIRMSILELLELEEFQGIEAENGNQGLQLAREEQPDLIICDIMMPDIDGYTVLTELQEEPKTSKIPFIFLTAKTERDDQRLGMELGADDYITKPFTTTELICAVKTRLKKHEHYWSQYKQAYAQVKTLKQKVEEIKQQSTSKEDIMTQLSEELRAPLSTINMAVSLLKSTPSHSSISQAESREKQQRYLNILQEECARELEILQRISEVKLNQTSKRSQLFG